MHLSTISHPSVPVLPCPKQSGSYRAWSHKRIIQCNSQIQGKANALRVPHICLLLKQFPEPVDLLLVLAVYLGTADSFLQMSIMILLLNAFLFLRTLPSTAAAPVALPANATSDEEYVAWQSQPNVRGTWDILLNCVVTMSLCIWTALHLNLPVSEDYKEARWVVRLWQNCIIRQVRWVIMGLFAPELVVYMAWTQRKRVYEMNRLVRFAYEGVSVHASAFQRMVLIFSRA